jgi:hypothetical protein
MEMKFYTFDDLDKFCAELITGASEGISSCICNYFTLNNEGELFYWYKINLCFGRPPLKSEFDAPRTWIKSLQE